MSPAVRAAAIASLSPGAAAALPLPQAHSVAQWHSDVAHMYVDMRINITEHP
jgi:hypothetical protein